MRLLVFVAFVALWPVEAFGQTVNLEFDPDRFADRESAIFYIEAAAMGGQVDVISLNLSSGEAVVEAGEGAGRLYRSDPVFVIVREQVVAPSEGRRFVVAMDAAIPHAQSGEVVNFRPMLRTGWAGERLRVVAYDNAGQEIGETFVPDPRFVRFEAWSEDGQHIAGSNRSFVQDVPLRPFSVDLPAEAAEISVFDQAGSNDSPSEGRLVGRVVEGFIREAE